ncbi:AAA family ATPase [Caulobacter sp. UC70_42]|uniref:AAA family ATPase n=1 Tax=Caulobacter sp. UC70_42 TaxID=3374551 RepID=UPI003757DB83
MRFSELQLIRYGRFEDCSLTFAPAAGCDLQIILGPNEAGKSTTLEAVSDLLFGFGARTRFGFRFDQRLLRVGAVLETADGALDLRRKKGRIDTLLGPDEQPIADTQLSVHLAGQTRESFERMFGLDHARLREGGKAILAAKDSIGAAIFAAGSGMVQVSKVCDALEAEAKAIWTRTAGESRRYTAAAAAYQAAKSALKEAEVRPGVWSKARRELDAAEAALQTLKDARAEIALTQRTVQRRRVVLPALTRRALVLQALVDLGETADLSADGAQRCAEALDAAQTAGTERALGQAEAIRLERELEDTRPAAERLAVAPEADSLRELKGVVDQGAAEQATLQAQLESGATRIRIALGEIGWSDAPMDALTARLPGRPLVAELRDLIERRSGVDERLRATREAVRDAERAVARLEERLRGLPPTPDVRGLQDLLRTLGDGRSQSLEQATANHEEMERLLRARVGVLTPWTGDVAALRQMIVPANEDVDHALGHIDRARAKLEAETQACVRDAERQATLNLDRRQATLAHPLPSLETLVAARAERDEAWAPLRGQLRGETPREDMSVEADVFERTVSETDRLADERFAGAEHAGSLATLERDIERADLQLSQAQARRGAAVEDLTAATDAFAILVRGLGIPLSPEAYEGWVNARADALQAADALDLARQDLEAEQDAASGARSALLAALSPMEVPDDAVSLPQLLARAQEKVDAAAELSAQARELRGELNGATEAVDRTVAQAASATETDVEWAAAWAPALQRAGLAAEASVAGVRVRLDLIEGLRTDLSDQLELETQLAAITKSRTAFETRIRAAAERAGISEASTPGQTYAALQAATREEAAKAERAETLERALEVARSRVREADALRSTAESALAPLLAMAPDAELPTLRAVLGRATEGTRLKAEIEALGAELLKAGEGRDLVALTDEAAGADPDVLAAEAQGLSDRHEFLER